MRAIAAIPSVESHAGYEPLTKIDGRRCPGEDVRNVRVGVCVCVCVCVKYDQQRAQPLSIERRSGAKTQVLTCVTNDSIVHCSD